MMNKDKLNELLDSIYELEGLVHLALTRDDNPARLPELITEKGRQLAAFAAEVSASTEFSSDEELRDDRGKVEENVKAEDSVKKEEESPADHEVMVQEIPTDSQPMMEEIMTTPIPMIEEDMQAVVESVFDSLPGNETVVEPASRQQPRGKLVFSINDRYRFKRELFGNSDADFNTTLALVASMDSYDEAEDYFLGEMNWDQKREEVAEFLEIIKKYFKE